MARNATVSLGGGGSTPFGRRRRGSAAQCSCNCWLFFTLVQALINTAAGGGAEPPSERIFPDNPNAPLPVKQNTCKGAPWPNAQSEQGQVFEVTATGTVTAIRFYAAAAESGAHIARLWSISDGKKLLESHIPDSEFNGTAHWSVPSHRISIACVRWYVHV